MEQAARQLGTADLSETKAPLLMGQQFGAYKIRALLGKGGMGEIYRARDTRLDRDMAIKVLPMALTNDPDRLSRFAIEAKVTGALNHPNILTVHDIGNHDGAPYIVAELLEGEELRAPVSLRRCSGSNLLGNPTNEQFVLLRKPAYESQSFTLVVAALDGSS